MEPVEPTWRSNLLTLSIEKPAAGGRMIARHDGQIVLVSGAIPGERVRARVEQVKGGVVYASATEIEDPSPDRREPSGDPWCGGSVYAHIAYDRQCELKGEVIADAFRRIARLPLQAAVRVRPSPERGYRMRARLHVRGSRIGFFREGTHDVCDPAASGQLLPQTIEAVESLGQRLGRGGLQHVREIELTENTAATERAVLIELQPGSGILPHVVLPSADVPAFTGVVVLRSDVPDRSSSRGSPYVTDVLPLSGASAALTLRRHVASFFQANRYLLTSLVHAVTELVPAGRVVDLYAGAGVFGLACAALQRGPVVAVESDRHGSQDLKHNARPFADAVRVVGGAVEAFLGREPIADDATLIVDPPRTGMSREATLAITRTHARRVIYVSCDVATLARDVRRLIDAGYRLAHIEGFDLFPNTAHVETVVLLTRSE